MLNVSIEIALGLHVIERFPCTESSHSINMYKQSDLLNNLARHGTKHHETGASPTLEAPRRGASVLGRPSLEVAAGPQPGKNDGCHVLPPEEVALAP